MPRLILASTSSYRRQLLERFGVPFFAGKKPWNTTAEIIMPCAIENEIDSNDASDILENGTKYYVEAANMPATYDALQLLRMDPRIHCAGSKAAGSGGVIVSALEMAQNSLRYNWSRTEVDARGFLPRASISLAKNVVLQNLTKPPTM